MGKGGWSRSIPPTPLSCSSRGKERLRPGAGKEGEKVPGRYTAAIHSDRPIVRGLGIRTRPEVEKAKEG